MTSDRSRSYVGGPTGVAGLVIGLVSLVQPVSGGGTKPSAAVIQGSVAMVWPVVSGTGEVSEYVLRRMSGHMSSEDSVAWLKSMTPGEEIAWVDRKTKGIALAVDVPNRADTLRATVYGPDTPIQVRDGHIPAIVEARSFAPMVPDGCGVCHLGWDLRSSAKKRVGPGLYDIALVAGEVTKEFYVVVAATP